MTTDLSPSWAKWHVGQRVWCKEAFLRKERVPNVPIVEQMYTIRTIEPSDRPDHFDCVGLRFEELINPVAQFVSGPGEADFCCHSFEPVKEQNIEVFREIARKAPTRKRANV